MSLRDWYEQVWPFPSGKAAVHQGYLSLRGMPHVLADIALRNYVFAPAPRSADLWAAGVAEGRRQAALEIIKLCALDPMALWDVIEAKPKQENRT